METSGDFYAVLGRASSAGHHFGSASLSCLCESTALCFHSAELCETHDKLQVMLLQNIALPVLKCCTHWLFWICICAQRTSLCCAGGSCMRCPHQNTHDQAWLKENSRWAKPNWHFTHKTTKTGMSQFVSWKPGLNKTKSLA